MTELLPCPFCGGEAETRTSTWNDKNYKWTVQCKTNSCMGEMGCAFYRTETEAIEAWNTRAERTCHETNPKAPYFKCDACGMDDMGSTELWISDGFYRSQKPNYCPNCGAKVVSE